MNGLLKQKNILCRSLNDVLKIHVCMQHICRIVSNVPKTKLQRNRKVVILGPLDCMTLQPFLEYLAFIKPIQSTKYQNRTHVQVQAKHLPVLCMYIKPSLVS